MNKLKLRFRISTKIMTLILAILISTLRGYSQTKLIEVYEEKITKLDTSIYFNIEMQRTNFLSGELKFIAITASGNYNGERISSYVDTAKTFHKNGNLKHVQIQDSLGLVVSVFHYNKSGQITRHCEFIRDYKSERLSYNELKESYTNYCRKYKKGQLIFEGKFLGRKTKDGEHRWYNLDGTIKKIEFYDKGLKVE